MVLEKLIDGCVQGNSHSQELLYKALYGKMMGVCIRYSNNREMAKDVLQEGFIRVFKSIKTYSGTGHFEGWVRRIMVTSALLMHRKNKLYVSNVKIVGEFYDDTDAESKKVSNEVSTIDDFYLNIDKEMIMLAIQNLTPQLKIVFNLYIDGHTHKEIAKLLKISEGTSKCNYSRAKEKLKQALLGKEGIPAK